MSRSQHHLLSNATEAAREAAAGRADLATAERIYSAARNAGIDRADLSTARRYLSVARAADLGVMS
jgi:hypothetical protein